MIILKNIIKLNKPLVNLLVTVIKISCHFIRIFLNFADNNILKLDTVDRSYIDIVDRPAGRYDLDGIIEKMCEFKGKAVVQTMFLKGHMDGIDLDNTGDRYVLPWLETIKRIAPREVMIYTIDRETPQNGLEKASREELDRIVDLLSKAGIKASASY